MLVERLATPVEKCQICSSKQWRKVLDLGLNPTCVFLTERDISENRDRKYPLEIQYCDSCGCVQSGHIVDPSTLFGEGYHHISGIPVSFRKHLQELAALLVERFGLTKADLVIDLGV